MTEMRFKHIFILAAVLSMAFVSCKKDKDGTTTTADSLKGSLAFSMPGYVTRGEEFSLTPSGVTNPTGSVGYYWTRSWLKDKDTTKLENGEGNGSFSFRTPSETGKYTVSCIAFAKGYYTSSGSKTFYVVNPELNTTVTGLGIDPDTDRKLVDGRDSKTYYAAPAGGKVWMMMNLAYSGTGASYEGCPAMDNLFGRFYTWNEAKDACPSGWHLPSDAEWTALANSVAPAGTVFTEGEDFKGISGDLMADARFLDEKMWVFWPEVNITNRTRFSAIPAGYATDTGERSRFKGRNSYAAFWTSDSAENNGIYRYFYVSKPDVMTARGDKESFRASVRCVKD